MRAVCRCFVGLGLALAVSLGVAQSGWSVSPTVTVPRTQYPVSGGYPGCTGSLFYEPPLPKVGLGAWMVLRLLDAPVHPTPRDLTTAIGILFNQLGYYVLFQTHTSCAEVCASIPADAQIITQVRAFGSSTDRGVFREVRVPGVDTSIAHLGWEETIDTTRVNDSERLVCMTAKNRVEDRDHRVYLIVHYAR